MLCVDSHCLQGVCSQCHDPLRSQNLASGTTYINSSKIHFEHCSGKALCTSVGDSHQCVWCCFLAMLNARDRKFISSSSEATGITKSSGTAVLTSLYVHCSHLSGLQALGFLSPCCFRSFSEVVSALLVHFGLWNEMPEVAG